MVFIFDFLAYLIPAVHRELINCKRRRQKTIKTRFTVPSKSRFLEPV